MEFQEWHKRVSIILVGCAFILVIVLVRLYQKSVLEHPQTAQAAENQYTFRQEVDGQRGTILVQDDSGNLYPLATNEREYEVLAVPINITDPHKTAGALSHIIGVAENDIFNTINNRKVYVPPLKHKLSRDQADQITSLHLPGVILLPELVRVYPEQSLASQLVGFVNADGQGNYGVEGTFDSILKGSSGYELGQKDNAGRLITLDDQVKAENGSDVVLTIDRDIQFYVEQALTKAVSDFKADGGSVIVVNPKTGAIIAMASTPTFDPNQYNTVDDPAKFSNPNVSSVWEPGSIAKPLVMALAIDKGLVQPDTKQTFGASVTVQGSQIWTAEKKAFGEETMTQVLENSDNVGMVWVSDKLGNQAEYDGLEKFGFGQVPSLKLGDVVSGFIPELKDWSDIERATASFGQGISVTPLQMVMAYAALANKGMMMQPYVVSEVRDANGSVAKTQPKQVRQVVSQDTANKVSLMLESVVTNGLAKRAGVPGYRVGAKTGTAQVPDPKGGYYDDRHIGSLAGYFPLGDPQYAMVVKLDQPKTVNFAESSAAPTFGEIASWILIHKQVPKDAPNS